MSKLIWEQFSARCSSIAFGAICLAVIDPDGVWCDTSMSGPELAVHWAAMDSGNYNMSPEEENKWFASSGYSIVSMGMLKRMFEAGLVS